MAVIEYKRIDLRLAIRRTADGFLVRSGFPDRLRENELSAGDLDRWFKDADLPLSFLTGYPIFDGLEREFKARSSKIRRVSPGYGIQIISRLALDIGPCISTDLDWEARLGHVFALESLDLSIVRVSGVRPRISSFPFTLPLRILQISPSPDLNIRDNVRSVFGEHLSDEDLAKAVQVDTAAIESVYSPDLQDGSPISDVLHFDELSSLCDPEYSLSTALPEEPGTLGWFSRVTEMRQTRLVVINCTIEQALTARRLAAAITVRGGPAVVVSNFLLAGEFSEFYQRFYNQLIHDFALDLCVSISAGQVGRKEAIAFFGGGGREELLRVSSVGQKLIKLGTILASKKPESRTLTDVSEMIIRNAPPSAPPAYGMDPVLAEEIVVNCVMDTSANLYDPVRGSVKLMDLGILYNPDLNHFKHKIESYSIDLGFRIAKTVLDSLTEYSMVQEVVDLVQVNAVPLARFEDEKGSTSMKHEIGKISNYLENIKDRWNNWHFEFHEREGLVPLSQEVGHLREQAGVEQAVAYEHVAPKVRGPRYVNSSLWSISENEEATNLDQEAARLNIGQTYHLGIQIGPKDARIFTLGETAIIEEVFKWTPEMKGTWVEIGVTGIDFEVGGDPVQEFWLPRETPSDMLYFAVIPRTFPSARLRFCLYHKQNLVQSFLLAALITAPDQKSLSAEKEKRLLARALGVRPREVGNFNYLSRLEYSLTASIDEAESRSPRTLSILVNDSMGEPRVTVKGAGVFQTEQLGNDLADYVGAVRRTLEEVSYTEITGTASQQIRKIYNFPKSTLPDTLKAAIKKLAHAGWQLYDRIIPGDDEEFNRIAKLLEKERSVIQVAHVLLEKVIPWAALYCKEYRPDKKTDENLQPVANDVCLAALPGPAGTLPADRCGTLPDCLLHPSQAAKRKAGNLPPFCEDTVACPLHFLGFKHIIEVPPHPVEKDKPTAQKDCILSDGKIKLLAGMNSSLKLGNAHWNDLNTMTQKCSPNAQWQPKITRREPLLSALRNEFLDFIYFYCHAHGSFPPYLEFYDDVGNVPEQMGPEQLGRGTWKHHPLVFLNGCETVGYSPGAMSHFITKMVAHRGASGIIGTEVSVQEELATDMAMLFLEAFLSGESAGEAMLRARRRLLARNNPLGLIYTLFAAAHLKIDLDGDGKCH